jgi:hypothetical protein
LLGRDDGDIGRETIDLDEGLAAAVRACEWGGVSNMPSVAGANASQGFTWDGKLEIVDLEEFW